jgi:hypothetical protein
MPSRLDLEIWVLAGLNGGALFSHASPCSSSTIIMFRKRNLRRQGKGVFNPDDSKNVRHTKFGVWDFYQERQPELARIPGAAKVQPYLEIYQSLPFVWRMLKELGQIKSCWTLLSLYLLIVFLASLVPALSLWYSGQLLKIVRLTLFLKGRS